MGTTKNGKPIGRRPVDLDKSTFEGLCTLQCTEKEICGFFHVTDKTLMAWVKRTYGKKYKRFYDIFQELRAPGKISLRRAQMRLAEKDAKMAIWMGKQYLDQREPDPRAEIMETADDGFLDALQGRAAGAWEGQPTDDPGPEDSQEDTE